jgi:hypothetical protein
MPTHDQQVLLATENAVELLVEDRPAEGFQRQADVTFEMVGPYEAPVDDVGVQHAIEIPNDVVDIDHANTLLIGLGIVRHSVLVAEREA